MKQPNESVSVSDARAQSPPTHTLPYRDCNVRSSRSIFLLAGDGDSACVPNQLHSFIIMTSRLLPAIGTVVLIALTSCRGTGARTNQAPAPATNPAGGAAAPSTTSTSPTQQSTPPQGTPPGAPPGGAAGEPAPRPYAQVIRGEVRTRAGLFTTHQIGGTLYFEIPARALGKDMLLVTQVAKANDGDGYGGMPGGELVVRWERRGHRVLLRTVSYASVSDPSAPIASAVEAASYAPILASFNVAAYGPDSAPVVDVSRLYTAPPNEISIVRQVPGAIDAGRSFLERVSTFPENVEVEATLTVNATPQPQAFLPGFPPTPPAPGTPPTAKSFLMHWSMVKLPDTPMKARLRDSRVGYFFTTTVDYGRQEQRAPVRNYITRWRLEKRDPSAAISEPVKPIEYYVDPATPAWLVPWVKAGIEEWQVAFEAAGFRRAIIAREAPRNDPEWSAEDARHSVVRWLPSQVENAFGPSVVDPRSGEILEADVRFYHNFMYTLTWWYWTQVGHLDPRAAVLPLPDSLQGRLVQFLVAHEVGHTLGLPHNQAASAMYPADSVRSRTWVARMGHSPTVMDYARFNYVAQPEDSIAIADLVPKIGPYDKYSVQWGYQPIPGARTPDEERPVLDSLARLQDTVPWFRYGIPDDFGAFPYTAYFEAVGDDDAIKSSTLGIRNLQRTLPRLPAATTKPTEDVSQLRDGYTRLLNQFQNYIWHVANVVGSSTGQEKYGSQPGNRFTPASRDRQRAAVAFMQEQLFTTPTWLLDPAILRRLEPEGAVSRINQVQRSMLGVLLDENRLARLVEYEALGATPRPYALTELFADLRTGIWSELGAPRVRIDAYRRGLQRVYLDIVATRLAAVRSTTPRLSSSAQTGQFAVAPSRQLTDTKAVMREELRRLDASLAQALGRSADAITRAHIADARWQIQQMLNPR